MGGEEQAGDAYLLIRPSFLAAPTLCTAMA